MFVNRVTLGCSRQSDLLSSPTFFFFDIGFEMFSPLFVMIDDGNERLMLCFGKASIKYQFGSCFWRHKEAQLLSTNDFLFEWMKDASCRNNRCGTFFRRKRWKKSTWFKTLAWLSGEVSVEKILFLRAVWTFMRVFGAKSIVKLEKLRTYLAKISLLTKIVIYQNPL